MVLAVDYHWFMRRTVALDVPPTPTFVLDYLYLGIPLGIIAGLGLVFGAVMLFLKLRKRGRGRAFAGAMAVLAFVVGDLLMFVIGINFFYKRPQRPIPPPSAISAPASTAGISK